MSEKPFFGEYGYIVLEESHDSQNDQDDIPVTRRKNSFEGNHKERIQSLFKSACNEYCNLFQDMEAKLVKAKSENEELHKSKEQSCVQIENMKAELGRSNSLNRELEKRIKKLEEDLLKAKENERLSEKNYEQTRKKLQGWSTTLAVMKEEFDDVCKQQDPTGAKKRKYVLNLYEINDSMKCPICLEAWTPSGHHNICSLSCGHFFGRSCITTWINKGGNHGSSKCPLCWSKATLKDIRNHCVSQTLTQMML